MRHGMAHRKLGRTSSHRKAMFRNQVASMILSERIITTLVKAKELRPIVEKFVTLGRKDSVHARRQAAESISDNSLVQKLFNDIAPRMSDREGGYTRIIKLGPRRGDGAEMAILEFVDYGGGPSATPEKPAKKGAKKGGSKKAAPAAKAGSKKAASKKGGDDEEKPAKEKKPAKKKKKDEDE